MRIAIYPGSFDPVTNGHLDIIKRAKGLCDRLIVAVAVNSSKIPLFSVEERIEMLKKCCSSLEWIEIKSFNGLLVDFCRKNDISIIIRGLRATADFEYEYAITLMNKKLADDIETIFLMADTEYSFVSSRIVKEVASFHGDITNLVPDFIIPQLKSKFKS